MEGGFGDFLAGIVLIKTKVGKMVVFGQSQYVYIYIYVNVYSKYVYMSMYCIVYIYRGIFI